MSNQGVPSVRVAHAALCVNSLDVSTSFYTNVFGFEVQRSIEGGRGLESIYQVEESLRLRANILSLADWRIELIEIVEPSVRDQRWAFSLMRHGITHLSFWMVGFEDAIIAVERWGGEVISSTRTAFDNPGSQVAEIIFVRDPDGTQLELLRVPKT